MEVYTDAATGYEDPSVQGATFAFNVLRPDGSYVSWMEIEKMANSVGVYIRAGGTSAKHTVVECSSPGNTNVVFVSGVCCPGGVLKALQYEEWEWSRMFSSGHACGVGEMAIINRRPTGCVATFPFDLLHAMLILVPGLFVPVSAP